MSPKRGERAAPPPIAGEWDIRFADGDAAKGWEELSRQYSSGLRRAYDEIRAEARRTTVRQHQLRGDLATGLYCGEVLDRWQYEVSGAARVWYLIDDEHHIAWVDHAGTAHPRATDNKNRR